MGRERVKKSLKLLLSNKVDKERLIPATLGAKIRGSKKVKVPNRDQYVYVRIHGRESEITQAFNDKTNYIYDLPVLLKKDGNRYVVVGRDTMRYPEWIENQTNIPPHGMQHSFYGGTDITWIHKKQFTPFSVSPVSGTVVYVNEDWFLLDENYYHFTGTQVNLAGAYPLGVNQARFVTLYFDTNSLLIKGITGTLFDINPLPDNLDPYIPSMHVSAGIPLASIFVNSVNKTVNWNSIYDLRPFLTGKSAAYSTMGKLAIYDNGVIKVTGSAIDFGNNLSVSVTGSIAFVDAISSITFLGLTDTPSSYSGQGGKVVSVKSDVSGLEFTTPLTGSGTSGRIARFSGTNTVTNSVMEEVNRGIEIKDNKELLLRSLSVDREWLCSFPSLSQVRDHFESNSMSSYWTGWTTTPNHGLSYNYGSRHQLYAAPGSGQANITCFLRRNQTVPIDGWIMSWLDTDLNNVEVGVRMDNGQIDNSSEWAIEFGFKAGVGTYSATERILWARRKEGSTVTTYQYSSPQLGESFRLFLIQRLSDTSFVLTSPEYVAHIYFTTGFTPTRHGIFVRNLTSSGPRAGFFNWYSTSFAP